MVSYTYDPEIPHSSFWEGDYCLLDDYATFQWKRDRDGDVILL